MWCIRIHVITKLYSNIWSQRLPTAFEAAACSDFPFVDLLPDADTAGTVGGGGFGFDTVVLFDAALAVLAACNEVYQTN